MPAVERFPRKQKFLLGERIRAIALDVLERLIEATYTRNRRGHLAAANLGLEKLRFLLELDGIPSEMRPQLNTAVGLVGSERGAPEAATYLAALAEFQAYNSARSSQKSA